MNIFKFLLKNNWKHGYQPIKNNGEIKRPKEWSKPPKVKEGVRP